MCKAFHGILSLLATLLAFHFTPRLESGLVEILKFGQYYKIWSIFWNLVENSEIWLTNTEIWLKFKNLIEIQKFDWNYNYLLKFRNVVKFLKIILWVEVYYHKSIFYLFYRSLVQHLEVLTMTPNKTSTTGNKLLLWCINF